jgi:hypothetical protein
MEAGIWTVRGRSFPFEAMLGVPMDRESVSPVCASMRSKQSSKTDLALRTLDLGKGGRLPTRKSLNSGSRRVRDFTDVWNMQSMTTHGLPAGHVF